jgi:hypothetical protein|tara:strand:- start:4316 stop:4732 length:417 start_codon:yes stop_codon:yes gene_type:complete
MGAPFTLQEDSIKDVISSVGVITDYLKKFEQKDISLVKLFADDVELIDWNIHKKGFDDVVKAYEDIFKSVDTFKITSPGIGDVSSTDSVLLYPVIKVDAQAFLCRIDIAIDNKEPLKVIDIITLNDKGLISKINAFKQ